MNPDLKFFVCVVSKAHIYQSIFKKETSTTNYSGTVYT